MCKFKTLWEKWGQGTKNTQKKKIWKLIITKHENMNGCLFIGMSLLVAEVLGVIKWQSVHGVRGNWRLVEESDLQELCLFLCLFIHLLCPHDNLNHVLKFYDIVSLKEMNDSPPAGFFGARSQLWPPHSSVWTLFSLWITECSQLFEVLHK